MKHGEHRDDVGVDREEHAMRILPDECATCAFFDLWELEGILQQSNTNAVDVGFERNPSPSRSRSYRSDASNSSSPQGELVSVKICRGIDVRRRRGLADVHRDCSFRHSGASRSED